MPAAKDAVTLRIMKGICIFLAVILMCLLLPVRAWAVACPVAAGGAAPADTAQTAARDSARRDSMRADTLREVVVRPDSVLPVVRVLEKTVGRSRGPRSMSLGDVIEKVAPGLQDKMLHPFAIKQRKSERRKKKMRRVLENYDRQKTFNELLDEAVKRQQMEDERAKREAERGY